MRILNYYYTMYNKSKYLNYWYEDKLFIKNLFNYIHSNFCRKFYSSYRIIFLSSQLVPPHWSFTNQAGRIIIELYFNTAPLLTRDLKSKIITAIYHIRQHFRQSFNRSSEPQSDNIIMSIYIRMKQVNNAIVKFRKTRIASKFWK